MLLFFLQSATFVAFAAAMQTGQSGPYYGLPLGSLHSSNDGTQAEIYAADDKNIMLVNFNHRPQTPGCNVLMAGPPRTGVQEQNIVPSGEGVIIPIEQPLMTRRLKRNSPLNSFYNWPFELDNLRAPVQSSFDSKPRTNPFAGIELDVGSGDSPFDEEIEVDRSRTRSPKPRTQQTTKSIVTTSSDQIIVFDGQGRPVNGDRSATTEVPRRAPPSRVRVTRPSSPTPAQDADDSDTEYITSSRLTKDGYVTVKRPNGRRIGATTSTAAPPTETPLLTPAPEEESVEIEEEETPALVPIVAQQVIAPVPRRARKQRTSTAAPVDSDYGAEAATEAIKILTDSDNEAEPQQAETTSTEAPPTTAQLELRTARSRHRLTSVSTTEAPTKRPLVVDKDAGQGLIIGDPSDANFRPPANVNPSFFGPLPRFPKNDSKKVASASKTVTGPPSLQGDVSGEDGYTAVFGVEPPATKPPRRAGQPGAGPPGASPPGEGGLVFVFGESARQNAPGSDEQFTRPPIRQRTLAPQPTRPFSSRKSAPVSSSSFEEGSSESGATPLFRVVEDPRAERRRLKALAEAAERGEEYVESTASSVTAAAPRSGDRFALPTIQGKMLTVSVPHGAKIADYEWFGIYDQCQQTRTAFVSLKDIQPPTEKLIGALKGTKHNVTSDRLQVLNCNTLLVPRFVLANTGNTESFFYVGIGEFPTYIVQQVRAYVVGRPPEEPLRDYFGEDVMVRLPAGWKTFDVNYMSVYSESERVSFGHVDIPPVVVPPCDEVN